MKFPRRKNDIVALTLEVLNGISANASDFPDPPFVIGELSSAFTDAQSAMNSRQAKEAELDIAIADERAKFANLKAELRKMLDLAEAYHRANPEKLSLISWGLRANRELNPRAQPVFARGERHCDSENHSPRINFKTKRITFRSSAA